MKENKNFSISIEINNNSDIDIDVLDKALLLIPVDLYVELFNRMKKRLHKCISKEDK